MPDWLLVRMAHDGSQPTGWVPIAPSGQPLDLSHVRDAGDLAAASAGRRVVLVLPATDVLHLRASLPASRGAKLAQIAPFALEDQVAEDLERLHFAIGRTDDHLGTDVDVVSREVLEGMLGAAREAGLAPVDARSEADLVPELPGQLSMLADEDHLIVRQEGSRPRVIPAQDPEQALELAFAAQATDGLLVTVHADALEWPRWKDAFEAWRARVHTLRVQLLANGVLPFYAAGVAAARGINLLQGSYATQDPASRHWKAWRVPAALAAVLLALHVAASVLSLHRLHARERALDISIQQRFSEALPGVVSGGAPRARLEQQLARRIAASPGPDGFLPLLSGASAALRANGTPRLQSATFSAGSLDIRLATPDAAGLDRIAQSLRAAGYAVQAQADGRLQLRSASQ
ncbi:MAG: hypothetical protein RLZZ393_2160 [Pseudomonadota bacterium]